jgi:GNAT superfamily N-acetyltransferase
MTDSLRLAAVDDATELARLRWDSSPDEVAAGRESFDDFRREFEQFLEPALAGGNWAVWVAEQEGRLVSQIWVQIIHKVPRPGRFAGHNRYGYVTNVYTVPERRGQRIGGRLLERVVQWAREQELEFLVVWPSEESVRFYERGGFGASPDALELHFDE